MGRISIDSVEPGMVVSKDACTFRGQLLLRAGTTVTTKQIETMRAWGVAEIETEGCAEATLVELDRRIALHPGLAAESATLDRRFADVRENPVMCEIWRIAKKQLLESSA